MLRPATLLLCLSLPATVAIPAAAQRDVVGADDEEEDGPPRAAPPQPEEKKDDKKDDDKKGKKKKDDQKPAEDKKPTEDKKPAKDDDKKAAKDDKKAAKDDKKAAPVDVLADSEEDKAKKKAEDEARKKADEAASAEDKKKAEEKKRLLEQKKLDEEKRLQETKADRLVAAKKRRAYRRTDGNDVVVLAEVEPGAVVKGGLVEMRLEVYKPLDVADPRFGGREPYRELKLVAAVIEPTGKKDMTTRYAVHSLGAPGRYGFHFTPGNDGVVQVQLSGEVGERRLNVTIPLHVGVWPPPYFEDEDKKLLQ
jgi:hypothetical protein